MGEITIGQVGRLVVDVGKCLYTPVTTFSWKSGSHTKFSGLKIGKRRFVCSLATWEGRVLPGSGCIMSEKGAGYTFTTDFGRLTC